MTKEERAERAAIQLALKSFEPMQALNERMVLMITHHGEKAFTDWMGIFNKMLDAKKWYIIFHEEDPKAQAVILSDNSAGLSTEEIKEGMKSMLEVIDNEKSEEQGLQELLKDL